MSNHTCHAPFCTARVPPSMWGCRAHWFSLPKKLRDSIWANYVTGQEVTKNPTLGYLLASYEAQEFIAKKEGEELPEEGRNVLAKLREILTAQPERRDEVYQM